MMEAEFSSETFSPTGDTLHRPVTRHENKKSRSQMPTCK
jgi:hypothetical protein